MASMSVLAAIGGRRPIPPVGRRHLTIGAVLLAAGLFLLAFAAAAGSGSDVTTALIAAAVAGITILAGVCFLCPLVVDRVARAGGRRRGVVMLATRSLGRHRARAAALLAAIVAVGAATTAVAASIEQAVAEERSPGDGGWIRWDEDVVMFTAQRTATNDAPQLADPETALPDLRGSVEALVGPVIWTEASSIAVGQPHEGAALVADDALLSAMEVPASVRERVAGLDVFTFAPRRDSWGTTSIGLGSETGFGPESGHGSERPFAALPAPETIVVDRLAFGYGATLVSPSFASERGFDGEPWLLIGRAQDDLTSDEADSLYRDLALDAERRSFAEFGPGTDTWLAIRTDVVGGVDEYHGWIRLGAIAATLVLMALIVTLGMALWAAEGRDERDTLIAVGASPSVLARMAATKAWLLAFVGSVLAVPLGFGTLRLAVGAADQHTTFPWAFAAAATIVLPVAIGAGAWTASAIGQRVHRVTASSFPD
jgi:hypothetical protein